MGAVALRPRGTQFYSIGYDIPITGTAQFCKQSTSTGGDSGVKEAPEIRAIDALRAIGNPGQFYNQPDPGSMNGVFLAIAADLSQGTSRLTRLQ